MFFQLNKSDKNNEVLLETQLPLPFEKLRTNYKISVKEMNLLLLEIEETKEYKHQASGFSAHPKTCVAQQTFQTLVNAIKDEALYNLVKERLSHIVPLEPKLKQGNV